MSEHDFKLNVDSLIDRLLEGKCNIYIIKKNSRTELTWWSVQRLLTNVNLVFDWL